MKSIGSHFLESPHTKLGWWAVGLTLLFVALLLSVTNDILPFSGFLTMLFGLVAAFVTLGAFIWKHERSWLIWLMLIPGLFAILFTLGELLYPH